MKFFGLLALSFAASANALNATNPTIDLKSFAQTDCLAKPTQLQIFTNGCHRAPHNGAGIKSYKADPAATPPTLKKYTSTDCSGTATSTLNGNATQPTVAFGPCASGQQIKVIT